MLHIVLHNAKSVIAQTLPLFDLDQILTSLIREYVKEKNAVQKIPDLKNTASYLSVCIDGKRRSAKIFQQSGPPVQR